MSKTQSLLGGQAVNPGPGCQEHRPQEGEEGWGGDWQKVRQPVEVSHSFYNLSVGLI